ncbi:MAG: MATE family efflux transporter [Lachnospiraceae bacterium]|nr:MATE family efflux transporter [Lachnospiraceae bacterium]
MQISLSDHFSYKKLLRFVLPTVVMMLVTSVYSIVDGLFVSMIVGKNAFAALNLIMPVLMALGSFGFMIGTGGSALIAKTLGEGDREKANQYFSMLVYVTIAVGVITSIIGFIFMRPLSYALGASELIIDDCVLYGRVMIAANTMFMLQNSFQSFFVTAEKPHMGLYLSLLAGLTNIVLDFLFVYVWKMGILGAALATAISQTIGGLVPFIYFMRKNKSLLQLVKTKVYVGALGKACLNGSSEMLTNISMSLVSILYNFQLIRIAAEDGIAAYGVIMYVNFIFMALFIGYSIGVGPIVGYHYGAGNTSELKSLFKKSMVLTSITSFIMTALGTGLSYPLAKMFVGYDAALTDLTANGLFLYSLSFLLCGFNIFGSAFFTALNNGTVSALISFLRTLVIQVVAVMILPIFLGINGIWLAIVAAEAVTFIVTIILFEMNKHRYQYR